MGLELFQLFHYTKGRFDLMDIAISILFWAFADALVRNYPVKEEDILKRVSVRTVVCLISYSIVYLAHVTP